MTDILEHNMPEADADAFRKVWRGFGSTVTIIATEHQGQRHAMLATAVTSVSMDPPSLLICVNRSASAYQAIVERGVFSLGLLPVEAREFSSHVARETGANRFSHGDWQSLSGEDGSMNDLPYLAEAQSTVFCQIDKLFDYGTHTIVVARVARVRNTNISNPLLYCEGKYGVFTGLN